MMNEFLSLRWSRTFLKRGIYQLYLLLLTSGIILLKVSSTSQFEYSWCLVRSRYPADIRKGIILLEDLFQNRDETNKRDYLYYLAIGNTKLKEYATALKYIRALLQVEPGNRQAQELEIIVTKKLEKDGMIGMAVAGGTAVALGGLVGLGIALAGRQIMKK